MLFVLRFAIFLVKPPFNIGAKLVRRDENEMSVRQAYNVARIGFARLEFSKIE